MGRYRGTEHKSRRTQSGAPLDSIAAPCDSLHHGGDTVLPGLGDGGDECPECPRKGPRKGPVLLQEPGCPGQVLEADGGLQQLGGVLVQPPSLVLLLHGLPCLVGVDGDGGKADADNIAHGAALGPLELQTAHSDWA